MKNFGKLLVTLLTLISITVHMKVNTSGLVHTPVMAPTVNVGSISLIHYQEVNNTYVYK